MEIAEEDEGFCPRAAAAAEGGGGVGGGGGIGGGGGSPPTVVISNSCGATSPAPAASGKAAAAKRRLLGSKSKDKEKEKEREREGLAAPDPRKLGGSVGRAMSHENTEQLSLKRLTLTSSQSVPKSTTLSLSRTASAVFSRSFEQVSNALAIATGSQGHRAPSPTPGSGSASNHTPDINRYSACSLQEEGLGYMVGGGEPRLSPAPHHKQPSPSISVHLAPDL